MFSGPLKHNRAMTRLEKKVPDILKPRDDPLFVLPDGVKSERLLAEDFKAFEVLL